MRLSVGNSLFKKFALAPALVVSFLVSAANAQAGEMHCLVGVLKGSDVQKPDQEPSGGAVLSLPLAADGGEKDFQVAGESVTFMLNKRPYADVFDLIIGITDRSNRSFIEDHLVYAGPTTDNDWAIKPGPGAKTYEFLRYPNGALVITPKFQNALQLAGKWGKAPFISRHISLGQTNQVLQEAHALFKSGKISANDALAITTWLKCTFTP